MEWFLKLALVHFLGFLSPGEDFIGITRFVLREGWRKSIGFCLGIALSQAFYILLTMFGLMQIFLQNEISKYAFYIVSCTYLSYLSISFIRGTKETHNQIVEIHDRHPVMSGFLLTMANPSIPIFYSVVIFKLIPQDISIITKSMTALYMSIMTFIYFVVLSGVFTIFREKTLKYMRWIEFVLGLWLMYISVELMMDLF
jgi:threonine efflux protein